MCIGQPGMQREKRHLNRERKQEREEQQQFCRRRERKLAICEQGLNCGQVKRMRGVIQPQNRHQHQDRANHCVQNEFQRGVNFAPVSPDADEEVHRNEHHFPEHEKEEEVERAENANHAGLEHEQHGEKFFYVRLDTLPRAQNRERSKERGQQDEEKADTVNAHVIVNLEAGDPVVKLLELIAAVAEIKSAKQEERQNEFDNGSDQREAANPNMVVAFEQKQRKRPKEREERQHRQDVARVLH